MATIHITEAEAAADFAGLLDRVRAGNEVVIKNDDKPNIVIKAEFERRTISETIARLEQRAKTLGYEPRMNADFAADMEEIIRNRHSSDAPDLFQRRTLSECIALAKKREEETGEAPVLDPEFADTLEEIIRNRRPWNPPAWD